MFSLIRYETKNQMRLGILPKVKSSAHILNNCSKLLTRNSILRALSYSSLHLNSHTFQSSILQQKKYFSVTAASKSDKFRELHQDQPRPGVLNHYTDIGKVGLGLFSIAGLLAFVSTPVLILFIPPLIVARFIIGSAIRSKSEKVLYKSAENSDLKFPTPDPVQFVEQEYTNYTRRILESLLINDEQSILSKLGLNKDHNDAIDVKLGRPEKFKSVYYKNFEKELQGDGESVATTRQLRIVDMSIMDKLSLERVATVSLAVLSPPYISSYEISAGEPYRAYLEIKPHSFMSNTIKVSKLSDGFDGINEKSEGLHEEYVINADHYSTRTNDS